MPPQTLSSPRSSAAAYRVSRASGRPLLAQHDLLRMIAIRAAVTGPHDARLTVEPTPSFSHMAPRPASGHLRHGASPSLSGMTSRLYRGFTQPGHLKAYLRYACTSITRQPRRLTIIFHRQLRDAEIKRPSRLCYYASAALSVPSAEAQPVAPALCR